MKLGAQNKVVDNTKPVNATVINTKTAMGAVTNTQPNMNLLYDNQTSYFDDRSFSAGQSMGLLLALTYPVGGTWTHIPRT